jgi:hypothetical protein
MSARKKKAPARGAERAAPAATPPKTKYRPYPGLRHYDEAREVLFAGREQEIAECANLLRDANVLVLHGRTGCGKSSFLHAGVKPYLARSGSPISFARAKDGFSVVRSTADPLRAFGETLLQIAGSFTGRGQDDGRVFGELASDVDPKEIAAAFPNDPKFQERVKTSARATFIALNTLAGAMRTPPIIVIDQAEEVFTLKRKRENVSHEAGSADDTDRQRDREYFKFIQMMASQDSRTRLVISLRTEYKGLFDDQIARQGYPGEGLRGFHLRDLDAVGLQEAILRPTLRSGSPAWDNLKARLDLDDDVKAPGDGEGALHISKDAARELAEALLSDKVPVGGVLPTLQAACIRLWEQSSLARERRAGRHTIGSADLRRLGEIGNQVEEYLQEQIERVCGSVKVWSADASEKSQNLPEKVLIWLGAMRDFLVRVEGDGRAVTDSIERETFATAIAKRLPGGVASKPVVEGLLDVLLDPTVGILKYDQTKITLGHDSLALALTKWSLATPRDNKMMMRMGMATMHRLRDLGIDDLFLKEDLPHRTQIVVPIDFNWDRQLPHFAQARGFAERLGIKITSDPQFDARRDVRNRRWNWRRLRETLLQREESWGSKRRTNAANERVMIAAEFGAFPETPTPDASDGSPTGAGKYAWRWSDLLVSNLFVGNALVGANPDFSTRISEAMKNAETSVSTDQANTLALQMAAAERASADLREAVVAALEEVLAKGAQIQSTNAAGRELLVFAAKVCGKPELARKFEKLESLKSLEEEQYDVSDPLIEFLLEAPVGSERFIIGSAATRAMARQCGYHQYFGAKEIAILAYKEMKRRQDREYQAILAERAGDKAEATRIRGEERRRNKDLPDLAAAVQKIVSHTVWNISVPAATWRQGLNRAFVLRLASLGYFTSEYVRSTMEDFVGYIHEFVNQSFEADKEGVDAMSGQRQMRYAVKEAVAECYTFLRFDEFGPSVFDLDSLYAYWSEHGRLRTRSVAGEIYDELFALRQRVLAHYQTCAEAIAWMRYGGKYDPSHEDISRAFRLKELAWNNFNIFNFYDAERYMSQAADKLRGCMEADFED